MAFPISMVTVVAAEDAVIYTEAAVSSVSSGETFSYSVYLSGTYDGYAIMLPKNNKGLKITEVKAESGVDVTDFDDIWMLSVIGGLEKKNSSKTKIATVKVSVTASAKGAISLDFDDETLITNESGDVVSFAENLAAVSIKITATGKRGDINGDGFINTKDAVLLAQYLAEWEVSIDKDAADCNGDGSVDTKDAVLLAQYLALWEVSFA